MERAGRLFGKVEFPSNVADVEARAKAAWLVAVGKKIAKYARATSLVRSTLVVEVGDAVWQRQLSTMSKMLLSNLAKELGGNIVTAIDFRPTPARRPQHVATSARGGYSPVEGIGDPVLGLLYKRSQGAK